MGFFDDPQAAQSLFAYPSGGGYGPLGQMLKDYLRNVVSGQVAANGMLSGNYYDPNRSFAQNALDPRAIENAANIAMGVSGGGLGIKAYHGSPYDFDAFDASKIGTGEGLQGFGRGLYFSENPNVARTYQSKVSAMRDAGKPTINGQPIDWNDPVQTAAFEAMRHGGDRQAAADFFEQTFAKGPVPGILRSNAPLPEVKPPGKLYEVNIDADPASFLDWDKPLSQQPSMADKLQRVGQYQPVGAALDRAYSNPFFGGDLVGADRASPSEVSQFLNQQGIPGIRYLDQGSRGAGQGTSNYVVFDPSIVEILRKYGIMGPVVPGALAPMMMNGNQGGS